MGYLNQSVIEIDAILTDLGRQKLAEGGGAFKITKFALSDDEIDYRCWNPNHTQGSSYYGEVIEAMPILEANAASKYGQRYKLFSQQAVGGVNYIISGVSSRYDLNTTNKRFDIVPAISGYDLNQVGRFFTVHCTVPKTQITSLADLNKILEFGVVRTDDTYAASGNGIVAGPVSQVNGNLLHMYDNTLIPGYNTWNDLLTQANNDANGQFGILYAYSFFVKRNTNTLAAAPAINTLVSQNGYIDLNWWVSHEPTQAVVANFTIRISA